MLGHHNTGWRKPMPPAPIPRADTSETTRKGLTIASRAAAKALSLRPGARHVLDQLVACYGDEPVEGRMIVWPSNEHLMERTGLSERAVRYALRHLLDSGIIAARDSANGKRFCVRSKTGSLMRAYGFDLTPLAARRQDYEAMVAQMKQDADRRRDLFDKITICRRSIMSVIVALGSTGRELEGELEALIERTPRRDSKATPDLVFDAWIDLQIRSNDAYEAAFGGKDCRHIENNNEPPSDSCQNGQETNGKVKPSFSLSDLADACPDAMDYLGSPQSLRAINGSAGRVRGAFGVHSSAWNEALDLLGAAAGPTFAVALQFYEIDQRDKATIRNFGGYFRSMMRQVADGRMDLKREIATLKFRRRN